MTGDDLARKRQTLGLHKHEMAQMLAIDPRTYRRWESGQSRIPGLVDTYLSCLLRFAPLREEAIFSARGAKEP